MKSGCLPRRFWTPRTHKRRGDRWSVQPRGPMHCHYVFHTLHTRVHVNHTFAPPPSPAIIVPPLLPAPFLPFSSLLLLLPPSLPPSLPPLSFVFSVFQDEGVVAPRLSGKCTQKHTTTAGTSLRNWLESVSAAHGKFPSNIAHCCCFGNCHFGKFQNQTCCLTNSKDEIRTCSCAESLK